MPADNELNSEIVGLKTELRNIFEDERGSVFHMVKSSLLTQPIGEVYFSSVKSGVTKGWKRHKVMWQRFTVPVGEVEFKFMDERPLSATNGASATYRLSKKNYVLLTVPPGVWYSFRCTSDVEALIVNAASIEHDPNESETRPL